MRFNGHERYWDFKQENRGFRSAGFFSNLNRASSTLFVDNLPNSAEIPWFTKLFSNFGYVTEAFIPNKRSKKTGNRFGFIRLKNKGDATHAIAETDGLWVGRRKLEVCMARYDRRESFMKDNQLSTGSNRFSPSRNYHNSFAEIVSGNKQVKQSNGNVPLKDIEKRASIYLQPSASEWLWRSAIAELKDISTPEAIQNAFTELSFKDIKVRSMGGLFMIITFHTKEDRNKALSDKVVEGWFKSLKHWNGDGASHSRIIWLKCRGMPLNAWNVNSFKRISELWGKFLTLDQETLMEESFDVGRLLMVTNLGYKIDQWINVTVKGRNYKVQVWEEECNDPFFALGSKQNSNLCQSNQCEGENKVPQAKALEKMNEGGKTAFVRKSSNEMAQYRAKEKVDDLANQSTNGNNDLDNMVVDHLELAFLKNTAEINENFGATNNEVAAVMDSLSSSLGKENSAVGSEKVLDSGVGDTNSVFSPNSFVMLSDEAKTSNVMKPQQLGEESDKEAENILDE